MKVTAVVTLSLAAVLILLDFDPTTGIRLTNQYADKNIKNNHHPEQQMKASSASTPSSVSSSSSAAAAASSSSSSSSSSHSVQEDAEEQQDAEVALNKQGGDESARKLSRGKEEEEEEKLPAEKLPAKIKRGGGGNLLSQKSHHDQQQQQQQQLDEDLMLNSGIWPMPVHFWNYLPHNTNSINNNNNNIHHPGTKQQQQQQRERVLLMDRFPNNNNNNNEDSYRHHQQLLQDFGERHDLEEEEEEIEDPEDPYVASSSLGRAPHHLSYLPDPDNTVSIHLPSSTSNQLLGHRLAALNQQQQQQQHHFSSNHAPSTATSQDGSAGAPLGPQNQGGYGSHYHSQGGLSSRHPEADYGHLEEEKPPRHRYVPHQEQQQMMQEQESLAESPSSSSLNILKRTSSSHGESSPGTPVGSRKTEDRKRANRPYDVPQIECPPADDGMERFACPSPDRQGRYRCIDDHVLCDGFLDCPEGEDEDRHACMFYKTTKAHLDVLADALLRWARGKR